MNSLSTLQKFKEDCLSIRFGLICDTSDFESVLDEVERMRLKVEADFYVATEGIAEILPPKESEQVEESPDKKESKSFKMRRGILLNQIASLLGDEATSDVIVSVRRSTTEDAEIGTFFCHSAILGGNVKALTCNE